MLADLRHANYKADEANKKWRNLSDELDRRWADLELIDRTQRRRANITLNGHSDSWYFWQRESVRLSATITAEYHARQMLG